MDVDWLGLIVGILLAIFAIWSLTSNGYTMFRDQVEQRRFWDVSEAEANAEAHRQMQARFPWYRRITSPPSDRGEIHFRAKYGQLISAFVIGAAALVLIAESLRR